jgi:hypothetical protein
MYQIKKIINNIFNIKTLNNSLMLEIDLIEKNNKDINNFVLVFCIFFYYFLFLFILCQI